MRSFNDLAQASQSCIWLTSRHHLTGRHTIMVQCT